MSERLETPDIGSALDDDTTLEEAVLDESDSPNRTARTPGHLERTTSVILIGAVTLAAMGAVAGWFGYHLIENRREVIRHNEFVEAARQGAINLTTIDFTTVDADVRRILDSSTGTFHDDFQSRSQSFADVVKKAQSKTTGAVTAAALESESGDQAQILVTVAMKTATPAAVDQPTQSWRMRIGVTRSGDDAKVSDVQFVA